MRRIIPLFLVLFPLLVNAQDCDELLKFKVDEYYINVEHKPDSLRFLDCRFIRRKLGSDAAFIDISEIDVNGTLTFIATVIRSDKDPQMIEIPVNDGNHDSGLVQQSATDPDRGIIASATTGAINRGYYEYAQLWSYIYPTLEGIHRIYYSSSRLLNLINFKFIKDEQGKHLLGKYDMVRLHSAASFLSGHQSIVLPHKMDVLVVGNISYECGKHNMVNGAWSYLPGTRTELNDIKRILSTNHYVVTLDSCSATELKLSSMINAARYDIVHIATHGFYLSESEKSFGVKDDTYPLQRSGIVLSGANSQSASVDVFNKEGLFTAIEMQDMNLTNIKFMVLSTCHSGEGDNSEYAAPLGMVLALLRNGVQAMMVSNRAVPDEETSLFMKTFYGYLSTNGDLDAAYLKTIRDLERKAPLKDWSFFDLVH